MTDRRRVCIDLFAHAARPWWSKWRLPAGATGPKNVAALGLDRGSRPRCEAYPRRDRRSDLVKPLRSPHLRCSANPAQIILAHARLPLIPALPAVDQPPCPISARAGGGLAYCPTTAGRNLRPRGTGASVLLRLGIRAGTRPRRNVWLGRRIREYSCRRARGSNVTVLGRISGWDSRGVQLRFDTCRVFSRRHVHGSDIRADRNGANLDWLVAPEGLGRLLIGCLTGVALSGCRGFHLDAAVGDHGCRTGRIRRAQRVITDSRERLAGLCLAMIAASGAVLLWLWYL
jgi:hypothetical protein